MAAVALVAWVAAEWHPAPLAAVQHQEPGRLADAASGLPVTDLESAKASRIGGYGGASHTYKSRVEIDKPPGTRMTAEGFDWIGMPFKSPIYYGARVDRVPAGAGLGTLLDFTHAKAIAHPEQTARLAGTRDGKPVPPAVKVSDYFKHLEFSHGHNILTLNSVWRMPLLARLVRPYAGLGGGITLPHTEIGFRDENARTYEYQWAGFAGQVLAGVEIPLGRASLFVEWKLTYAPYSVPLSHEPKGHLLVTDVWRQMRAAMAGETPPGGTLKTRLLTHHGYGGVMVRLGR